MASSGKGEERTKRWGLMASACLCVALVAVCAIYFRSESEAQHKEALADTAAITRDSKAYWDDKKRRMDLDNDLLQLKNDRLLYEIAGLEGKPRNGARIAKDIEVIRNDELAIKLSDQDAPKLTPRQTEDRIAQHNRKYPHDQIANISDLNREMEEFNSKVNAIIENGNAKLRAIK